MQDEFEMFYQRYYSQLYLYAFSLCRNDQQAQDLVSETFYRMISVEIVDERFSRSL